MFIYKHIFGDSEAIKKRNSTASLGIDNHQLSLNDHITVIHVPLETSVLATNKLIHREAIEVLYHNRTIRATIPEFGLMIQKQDFVDHAEKVEIADCKNGFEMFSSSIILQYIQTLPQMVSIVILSDCLYSVGLIDEDRAWSPSYADIISVPDFVQGMARLGHATCVDIGRYQLHGRWCKVQIVNRRLTKMWPSTQDIPEEFDFWEDFENVWLKWSPPGRLQDRLTLVLQSSFRCWVGFHEKLAAMTLYGELSDLLKRHLLVSDWADPKDVQDMSLKDMRHCLIALLRRPDLKEIRTEPPKDVDDDLFMPLAWKWGWEYSNACVERLQAGREVEQSSEWEDFGSEAASGDDLEEEE